MGKEGPSARLLTDAHARDSTSLSTMKNVMDPGGQHLSIHNLQPDGEVAKLRERCEAIENLSVYEVGIHGDHKRFYVRCAGRNGAEKLVPATWCGVEVVRLDADDDWVRDREERAAAEIEALEKDQAFDLAAIRAEQREAEAPQDIEDL